MDDPKKDTKENSQSQAIKVSLFDGKSQQAFIHLKAQKLATALYLVTELIKDKEPLKWHLREKGLLLVTQNLSVLSSANSDNKKLLLEEISATCVGLVSLIEIAFTGRLLSEMNFQILRSEFLGLLALLDKEDFSKQTGRKAVLSDEYFKADNNLLQSSIGQTYKGQNSVFDTMSFKSTLTDPQSTPSPTYPDPQFRVRKISPQPSSQLAGQSVLPAHGTAKQPSEFKDKKLERQGLILQVVKRMNEVTIRDLVSEVSGCSEKTIQRELTDMVLQKVLKKVGERRWSKYSLNS